jgi:hypothetical protein
MFQTPKVQAYLNNFTGHGDDEEKELKLSFYVTPISYQLASEVSPQLADRLFRNNGDEWQPAQEMPKASFSSIQVPKQNLIFHPHSEPTLIASGIMVQSALISNLRAQRAFPDKPDFRLEFDCVIPMDKTTMDLVHQYYKKTCFLTTEPSQVEMEFDETDAVDGNALCEECSLLAVVIDSEQHTYCQTHIRLGKGEIKFFRKKETPAEAEARVLAERNGQEQASESEEGGTDAADGEAADGDRAGDDGAFINSRNRRTRKPRQPATVN